MRVRLLTSMVTHGGTSYSYGQVVDLPDDVAARLVATQQAEALPEVRVEEAVAPPVEQAVHPANRRRRGR